MAPIAPEQVLRERLLRSLAAMGVAAFDDLCQYWTWPRNRVGLTRAALDSLIHDGLVTPAQVAGQKGPWYVRTEDLPALASAARMRRPSHGTTLLCPFDSFLWYRERVHRLWSYFYRIEIYVPDAKRQHGYYSLPVLHEGQLIGRIDAKAHRDRGEFDSRSEPLE